VKSRHFKSLLEQSARRREAAKQIDPNPSRLKMKGFPPDRLAFWNIDRQLLAEPGEFAIMV
jgi:hypothetical protein